ncbi:Bug family tripartite tricarboxylate transporter substrate binding protein [Falsiroseomonas sp. HW251]|uniref:Bug family tripartite tricarboxylate transporter substrate binding protein n=1 Tax=Falsiroseomonas sp. HW251 TaxID=3390998 RepID=UPI003D3105C9
MNLTRRAVLGACLTLPFARAAKAAFPDRSIRMLVGFPAGTAPDLVARLLADALKDAWPAGVVVENRPGAAGHIAAAEASRAAADGYNLLFSEIGQIAMAPSTFARLTYDPKDLAPIARVVTSDFALVVPASLPVADLDGFVAWARQRPTTFFGTFGPGTLGHFGAVMLAAQSGFSQESVHFRATGEGMTALLNGDVQGLFGSVALVAPHVRAGRLKALAVTGPQRSALLPDVATMAQLGRPGLEFEAWFGVTAPVAVPAATQVELEGPILRALANPAVRSRLQEAGFTPAPQNREAFAATIRADTARWAQVVRETGFRALE